MPFSWSRYVIVFVNQGTKEERDPPLETLLDFLISATLLTGMVLLLIDIDSSAVRGIWKPVSVLVAIAAVYTNLRDRFRKIKDPESAEDHFPIAFADFLAITLFLPSIAFNLFFAFSG